MVCLNLDGKDGRMDLMNDPEQDFVRMIAATP